jgi:hypothetical protein
MFKSALSSLAPSVVSSAKATASSYLPTGNNLNNSFNRIAEQGIANLSFRSPILADVATTMLQAFQAELEKKESIKSYAKSDSAADIREQLKAKLGKGASDKKVEEEVVRVLDKMNKLVETGDKKQIESSDLFKEFGTHFKKFSDFLNPKSEPKKKESGDQQHGNEQLDKIEVNTRKTVDLLNTLDMNKSGEGIPQPTPASPNSGQQQYIDPLTGMPSIRAAVGSIGGTFLGKVFNDDLLTKYADKIRGKITPKSESVENSIESPKKDESGEERIGDILKNISRDMAKVKFSHQSTEVSPLIQPMVSKIDGDYPMPPSAEAAKEGQLVEKLTSEKFHAMQQEVIDQLKILVDKTKEGSASSNSMFGSMIEILKSSLGSIVGSVGSLIGKAAPLAANVASKALPVAAVAAAGAAGYMVGDKLVNPLINKGITAATGQENTLGTWLYDKFNDDPLADMNKPAPVKKNLPKAIQTEVDRKAANAAKSQPVVQPVVIQQPAAGGGGSSTTIIANSPVRNKESTFEQVQMNDYWPRGE